MNRRFRLASVLRVRRVREELARADVGRARGVETEQQRRLDDSVARLRAAAPTEDAAPHVWLAAVAGRLALAAEASTARAARDVASGEVARALETWTGRQGDVRLVERLEQAHAEAVAAEDLRREQLVLDDLAHRQRLGAEPGEPGGAR